MSARIEAAGPELVLPEGIWQLVPWPDLDGAHGLSEVEEGAVYRLERFEEEAWEAVIRVPSGWTVFEGRGQRRGLAASPAPWSRTPEDRWVGLLRLSPDDDQHPGAPRVAGGRLRRTERGWTGDGWSLEAHPCTRARLRPWTWIEPVSWFGTSLRIRHRGSREQARAWLARHAPLPYEETAPDRLEDAFRAERRSDITLSEGAITLWHSCWTSEAVDAVEPGLLADLVGGALGPFVWDIVEQDWYVYVASGEDPASLGEYLDPRLDQAPFRARRDQLTAARPFDLRAEASPEAMVRALAAHLGEDRIGSVEAFERWLSAQPVPSLPRSWSLRLHPALEAAGFEWFMDLFFRAQPRLRLSWTVA